MTCELSQYPNLVEESLSKTESMRGVDTRTMRRTITAREQYQHHRQVFFAVVAEYVKTKNLPCVAASSFDPESRGSVKLGATQIEFLADVEAATDHESTLKGRLDLQRVWFKIALHEPVDKKLERETIQRCGRMYATRGLAPDAYFEPNKYGHRRAR